MPKHSLTHTSFGSKKEHKQSLYETVEIRIRGRNMVSADGATRQLHFSEKLD